MKKIIFIVDDCFTALSLAENALSEHYKTIALPSAEKMFRALDKFTPDLILLDIEMPEMDGFDSIKWLKANSQYAKIPIIFLTAVHDPEREAQGIGLGAVDFIMKPFAELVLLNRIKNHLDIDSLVRERTRQLEQLKNAMVLTLANVVENRDSATGGHISRTTAYMRILIDSMLSNGVYNEEIDRWDIESVISSARLHDLGKISIPDSILNKPGKLTPEEFETIKTHAVSGMEIIDDTIAHTGDADFLHNAKLFAAYHHEKWDGTGYPFGLTGPAIPLQGRIMAVVDVYDALVSERPYKKAVTHAEAVAIILNDSGKHFDPLIVEVFNNANFQINMERGGLHG